MRGMSVLLAALVLTACASVGEDLPPTRTSLDVLKEVLPAMRGDLNKPLNGCETVRAGGRPETTCESPSTPLPSIRDRNR